jgi:hypothetical protein
VPNANLQAKFVCDAGRGWPQTVVNVPIKSASSEHVERGKRAAAEHVASAHGVPVKACLSKVRLAWLDAGLSVRA